ncbi:MAG: S1C family serine protease [Planctomycetota bacterium]|nr:S1C family serine protease [Planctomycetota bacterium]
MRNLTLTAAFCALALLVSAPLVRADEDAGVYEKLMADKAASVVSVKFVLNVKVMRDGAALMPPQEQSGAATGVVVDSSGLVMIPGAAFGVGNLGIPRRMRAQLTIQAVPSNIRVVFPGDTKEYEAVLGAKDSKLGLAFVLIRDLGDKKIAALDTASGAEPKIGQTLYAVSRLDQGFDHAPMVMRAKVAGKVSKPRDMWIVQGAGGAMGQPLFDIAGAVAGIMVSQEGVGEDSEARPFLLPLKVAAATIKNSLSKSKDELDRVLEEEEEAAAEDAEDGDKGDADKGDGDKKDAPKKDDGDK